MNTGWQTLLARHLEAENGHDLDATLATLHPDCVFEDRALELNARTRAGAAAYYRAWWDGLDVRVEGERLHVTADGTMIGEARYRGTHVGTFFGLPPTGRAIDLPFVVLVTFREGLMAGERFYYDTRRLLAQLGAPGATFPRTLP